MELQVTRKAKRRFTGHSQEQDWELLAAHNIQQGTKRPSVTSVLKATVTSVIPQNQMEIPVQTEAKGRPFQTNENLVRASRCAR